MVSMTNCTSARDGVRKRLPAVAGSFYPADSAELRETVDGYLAAARTAPVAARAVIAPHAGYVFSGPVAAEAFAALDPVARYERVFLLGPSHCAAFDGVSVDTEYSHYLTPLGSVGVDRATGRALQEADSVFRYYPAAHEGEHCLEVELPFLQARLEELPPVVPLIVGTQDWAKLERAAAALQPYFTPGNLFVVSSDFSHYPAYADAVRADAATAEALETGSAEAFLDTLADNAARRMPHLLTSACGQAPVALLLLMAERVGGLEVRHLAYANSGDSPYGDRGRVVGYHAFALVPRGERTAAPAEQELALSAAEKRTLLALARRSIGAALTGRADDGLGAAELTPGLKAPCGAFVTLTSGGRLRGCIGNLTGHRPLYRTVAAMARAAAFEDPRFRPLTADELPRVRIEISVLSPLRRIRSADEFRLGRHGIFMVKGRHQGTFLPQVAEETGWTKEEFLGHCARDKAGIGWDGWREADLYVYEAEVFHEPDAD